MFTEECLKYVDVCLLCDVLGIEVEDVLAQFPDKVEERMDELKELFDMDEDEQDGVD
jgi:hypothetical protein